MAASILPPPNSAGSLKPTVKSTITSALRWPSPKRPTAAIANDPWDGRVSREHHFAGLIRQRYPRARVEDLTPIVDELRSLKSPREIALIKRASQIAGYALIEAMKSTRPQPSAPIASKAATARLARCASAGADRPEGQWYRVSFRWYFAS